MVYEKVGKMEIDLAESLGSQKAYELVGSLGVRRVGKKA